MRKLFLPLGVILMFGATAPAQAAEAAAPLPTALLADDIPAVPAALATATEPWLEFRTAAFVAWDPADRSMIVATRFADTSQLHRVAAPGSARTQITFAAEPVTNAAFSPDGSNFYFEKDNGGNEVDQLFVLREGRPQLLSDGKSRNSLGPWSRDGKHFAFSSNRASGRFNDIYIMDPAKPDSPRMLMSTPSGGWFPIDFTPDAAQLLVFNYVSVSNNQLYLVDTESGAARQLTASGQPVSYVGLSFAPDGRLWAASNDGADKNRVGTVDTQTGVFTPVVDALPNEISSFTMSDDGRWIAYEANVQGRSELTIYDVVNNVQKRVEALPPGVLGAMEFAPWGELGFTFTSNRDGTDAYSLDPATLTVRRWTSSETGGLNAQANALPELIETRSFDGEAVSGFLYRPDPRRHAGKRPLIIAIHGGPEGQATPAFLGRNNYLINELGIALFYPNVRGSTGFGKRFVGLDDGPFRRENSVRDIGAFLDRLAKDKRIDAKRIGVTGGSYGGYMTLASMIAYGKRLKAGLEVVGISNFVTFLENTESYRQDLRRIEYGDERIPAQREKLLEISPLTRVSEISIPLMVVTGANDPRVPASEAEQIVSAVRGNGGVAWHLLAENEGHGFAKKANADYQFWASLLFWQKYLLGN